MGSPVLVPIALALTRLRARAHRTALVFAGIAIGAAVLAATSVGAVAVQDRAVQRALAALPPSDRALVATWSGVPAQSELSRAQLDRTARRALRPVLGRDPFRVTVFRQATWGGAYVSLGAVDGARRWLVLRSGRLPAPCTPARCEVVQIGGAPVAPSLPYLRVVGRAAFRARAPLAAFFGAGGATRPPILLADGVRSFAALPLPDADLIARVHAWVVPVAPDSIREWEIPGFQRRLDRALTQLEAADPLFGLSAPTDTLKQIRATSRVGGQRLLIVGGDGALLLVGFAVLASTRLRADHRALRRRLTWLGARRAQIALVVGTEVAGIAIAATVVGWAAGAGGGALLARHLGAPPAARSAIRS